MTGSTQLIAIAAMAENRVIGRDGGLPWKCSADLKFFKRTTMGHAILFGSTTFKGLGCALPGRENLVLSRSMEPEEGIRMVRSVEELEKLGLPKIFVCGGAEVYRQLLPHCDGLYLTRISGSPEGDAFMPSFEEWFGCAEIVEEGEGYRIERHVRKA